MKNISVFYMKKVQFLEVKFSVYLNRRVFVMFSSVFSLPAFLLYLGVGSLLRCSSLSIKPTLSNITIALPLFLLEGFIHYHFLQVLH